MEDNFRNVLIILSTVVIGGIFVHGLWTIRKNKNPYKLKAKHEKIDDAEVDDINYDGSGFDQHGVGKVKVVSSDFSGLEEVNLDNSSAQNNQSFNVPKSQDEPERQTIEPILGTLPDIENETNSSPDLLDNSQENYLYNEVNQPQEIKEREEVKNVQESIYQTPVTQEKPKIKRETAKQALKRNQMEIDFENANNSANAHISKADKKQEMEPEVLILSVVMPENELISGAALLPCLLTLGMKYGDMNIFHRHQDNAGNGKVTFSLANIVNPGTFDLDSIETFSTPGVTLFMTLPNAGAPFEVFEQMLSAAKQISQEFNGQLLDDKRSVMTKQTEQHYIGRVREFDRKSRISSL